MPRDSLAAPTDAPLDRLSGLVERVTFHSDANGYCVLRLKVKGEQDLVTLVGYAPSVTPGEYASASGNWVMDREYGRQFHAKFLKIYAPTTVQGIEKYLGSGMVKGIGPFCAKTLVSAFGTEVFNVIEQTPEKLKGLRGIGPKRIQKITSGWADQKVIREIMVFLHGHGVSTSKSVRIFKAYGQDAVKIVKENPYRLAKDIRGIGFRSADTIAQNIGIEPTSPIRARAGVAYALSEASGNQGHCCLPRSELVKQAVELLNIPEAVTEAAIDHELEERELTEADFPQASSIYLTSLYLSEKSIARSIKRLLSAPPPWQTIDPEKAIPWVEERLHLTLAESQKKAVAAALKSKVMVITGGPGVGKTTIVKAILTILKAKGLSIQLCAPTGRAAKRLSESSGCEAKTIHRMLEIDPSTMEFKRNEERPLECDLLVADECSMVDVPLANNLLKAVSTHSALIIVGDVDQLPSVGPGAFLSDLIDSGAVPVIRLTEVFRQAASSWIIKAAHQINHGLMPAFPRKEDKGDCYFLTVEEPEELPARLVNLVKDRLPKAYGVNAIRDIQVLCPMNRGSTGARALNEALQAALNPPNEASVSKFGCRFSVGDKVMQIENNYERDVFNGDIGFVTGIDSIEEELAVDFDGREVIYPYGELDELVLCYATTIHKSQGSEYPIVVMPITMQHFVMLKRNLIYTGVTRGKKLMVLMGQKKALAMAVKGKQTIRRLTGLKAWLTA
jgi:exodeoxyribonuclease V alpha subunit